KELEKTPVNEIAIDLVLRGTYYEILNYINTIEIMPRIIKVEDIVVQMSGSGDYKDLLAFIIARTYFTNEYYK
ncbi:MAG: type 4a pilus biogenesis protein PilO, partial [Actinobacteria bacterium]|nr:type 4a pilus biogenesis protein PilO [Actinomycetota bacterium]